MQEDKGVRNLNLKFSNHEYLFLYNLKETLVKAKGVKRISWEDFVLELAKKFDNEKEKDVIMELELAIGSALKRLTLVNITKEKIDMLKDYLFAIIEGNKEWEKEALKRLCENAQ